MKKRMTALVLALLLIATMLCACGKKTFTCDMCGREVHENPHTMELLGEKLTICEDCYESVQELKDSLS